MDKKTINPKIRTALMALFAFAIVFSTTSLIMQSNIQFVSARNYFEDPATGDIYSCSNRYDRALFTDDGVICLD